MDETELSFIRCPNCRSLVPAVASRCRMCGFILKDASSKQPAVNSDSSRENTSANFDNAQESGEERPSRVRQRTISVSGNANFASSGAAEVKQEQALVRPVAPPPPPPPPPSASIVSNVEQTAATDDFEESFDEDFEEEDEESDNGAPHTSNGEVGVVAGSELVRKKRRRRRRKKKPLGQSIDQGSTQTSTPEVRQEPTIMPVPTPTLTPTLAPVSTPAPQVQVAKNDESGDEGIAPWRTPPAVESRPGFKIEKPIEQAAPLPMVAKESVETQRRQEPRQTPVSGALIGWLVSYVEDNKGISTEVRDGRFFVGRDRLRPTDFVIDHSTVSTPQCLVVCDSVSGVTIQDLMSERGTTVIRGSSAIEKSSEQVRLENGDRIRFGEYEMLFIKLPQSR